MTTPQTLVERVAKAIGELEFRVVVAATNGHENDAAKVIARAAIAAMREPSERMAEATSYPGWFTDIGDPKKAYRAMIQAALSEGVEG